VARLVGRTAGESAAVNPEHDGELAVVLGRGGRVDVEVEAIFAFAAILKDHVVEDAALHAVGAELGGVALASPLGGRLRGFPAQVADGRRGVRQGQPCEDLAVVDGFAVNFSVSGFDGELIGRSDGGEGKQKGGQKEAAGSRESRSH
jgi:hypothetical protein